MKNIYDLVIIGGGPAGLTAAIYAGRAKQKVLIIEKESVVGGQIKTTNEVVNYPGIPMTTGENLALSMKDQAKNFGAELIQGEVLSVQLNEDIKIIKTTLGEIKGFSVLVATGGTPRKIGFKGEEKFKGRGVGYCATCDGEFFTGLEVFVIGGGYAAAEEAIFLTRFAKKVTIIVREPEFTCAQGVADRALKHPNIEVKFNTEISELIGDKSLEKAIFKNNKTGEEWTFIPEEEDGMFGVFVFAGYKPETEFLKDKINMNPQGYIVTDEKMCTNVEGVYAAGDVREKTLRQVVTAVSDGSLAAVESEKYVEVLREKLGIIEEKEEVKKEIKKPRGPFLAPEIKEKLIEIFGKMTKDVYLATVLDMENQSSIEVVNVLEEFSQLNERIKVIKVKKGEDVNFETFINADKIPVISLLNSDKEYSGIKFHGIPGGHEINSFVIAIYNLGIDSPNIDEELKEFSLNYTKKTNLKVLISLSCHLCPEVVMNLQKLALINKNVETEMIDIGLFPNIKRDYKIMSVPAILKNDGDLTFGSKSITEIIKYLNK